MAKRAISLDQINELLEDPYPLTERQFNFCLAYAKHAVGMRAIRDAGFVYGTHGSQSSAAYRLLQKNKIRRTINYIRTGVMDPA